MKDQLLFAAMDGAAAILLIILAIRLVRAAPKHVNAWIAVVICVGALSYLFSSRQDYGVLIP